MRTRKLLATVFYLTLAVGVYIAVTIATRGSGLEAEDVGAVFVLGPATLIYAAALGALAARRESR